MDEKLKRYLSEATKFASDSGDEEAVVIATEGKKEDDDKKVVVALSKNNLTKFPNKPGMFKKKKAIKEEEIEDIADSDELEEEETEDDESYNEDSMNEEDDENIDADKLEEDEDDGAEDGEICEEEMADDDQIEEAVGNRTIASMGPAFAKLSHEQKTKFIGDRRKMLTKSKHAKAKDALSDLDALEKEVNSKKMDIKESYIANASRWM